jgi:hypothetical protein
MAVLRGRGSGRHPNRLEAVGASLTYVFYDLSTAAIIDAFSVLFSLGRKKRSNASSAK